MISYDEYENLIVARLSAEGVDVSTLPMVSEINEPRSVINPRIYVIFTGSTFEDAPNLGDFAQNEPLSFEVYIQARTRDGEKGIFAVAEEVIQRLLKWKFKDTIGRVTLNSLSYERGTQNGWQYVLKFTFPRLRIMPESEPEPRFIKQITTKNSVKL